jgi:hypothetical protein
MNSTHEQMIEAQRYTIAVMSNTSALPDHLLTPDALAALLREFEKLTLTAANAADRNVQLRKQRDQWRECAMMLECANTKAERAFAVAHFDRLKAQEAGE